MNIKFQLIIGKIAQYIAVIGFVTLLLACTIGLFGVTLHLFNWVGGMLP